MKTKVLGLLLTMVMVGCAAHKPVVGSANQFDSDTYLTLATTDGLIQATKTQLANNSFSATATPQVKTSLNQLIVAYNAADTAWQAYHAAALVGTSTPAQLDTVSADMSNLQTATATLVSVKGGK